MPKLKKRRPPRQFILRKKTCLFCTEKSREIDYKDVLTLSKFTTERGKIIPRRVSGVCAGHQRLLAMAMKRARFIALLPFVRQ